MGRAVKLYWEEMSSVLAPRAGVDAAAGKRYLELLADRLAPVAGALAGYLEALEERGSGLDNRGRE